MGLPAKLSITSSNYVEAGKSVENWQTVRLSHDISLWDGATVSADIGFRQYTERKDDGELEFSFSPAFEAKYKQKFSDYARMYLRYRNYGLSKQMRVAAGATTPKHKGVSAYADAHFTMKQTLDYKKDTKYTTGAWLGIDYTPEKAKNWNFWLEVQENVKLGAISTEEKRFVTAINAGLSYSF